MVGGVFEFLEIGDGTAAGERLHAPHSRCERTVGDDLEHADVAGAVDVAASAELTRVVARRDDANDVAVFLVEHRDGARAPGLADGHALLAHLEVLADLEIDLLFDEPQLLVGDRLVVRVVEPQTIGSNERAGLLHCWTEDVLEGLVQQVRGRVVGRRVETHGNGDRGAHSGAGGKMTFLDADARDGQVAHRFLRVEHPCVAAVPHQSAGVADLPAGLGIERRRRQDHFCFLAVVESLELLPFDHDGFHDRRYVDEFLIADEADRTDFLREAGECGRVGRGLELRRGLRFGPGARHHPLEAFAVERDAFLFGHLADEVDGNAERVVQPEHLGPA